MLSISKIVGLMSCGFLLCLGLSSAAQAGYGGSAADEMKAGQSDTKKGAQAAQGKMGDQMKSDHPEGEHMIEGKLVRVEGENYFVKGRDGKEVRVHTDQTTQKIGNIHQGARIEAGMNDQDHALWIRAERLDRRNEADTPTDSTLESGKTGSMGQY